MKVRVFMFTYVIQIYSLKLLILELGFRVCLCKKVVLLNLRLGFVVHSREFGGGDQVRYRCYN